MRLWLDDLRQHPEGWERAYTAKEARAILETGEVEFASLDHDLGHAPSYDDDSYHLAWGNGDIAGETGYDVVKWMAENNIWPRLGVRVHTDNYWGRKNMVGVIEDNSPYTRRIFENHGVVIYTNEES